MSPDPASPTTVPGAPTTDPGAASPIGYLALLRQNPGIRHLWLGRLVSNMGDWFNIIALFMAVQSITDSAQAVVLVVVAKTLPIFLMSPIAGPLVDRHDRRTLLIASDLFRFFGIFALILSYWLDSLVGIYVCVTLMVCATGITVPAMNAALPMLVPPRRVPTANALLGGTWSVSLAFGAALGGAVTELLGITAALFIDGATFAISAYWAWKLPRLPAPLDDEPAAAANAAVDPATATTVPERPIPPGTGRPSPGFREGLRYLRRTPYILCAASLKTLMQLAGGLIALTPLFGTVVYPEASGPWFVGILYAARGVGSTIGSLVPRALFGDDVRTMRGLLVAGFLLSGLSFAGLGLATAFWQAALAFFAVSIAHGMIWVFSGSLLQIEADRRYHGRVFALEIGVMTFMISFAGYVYGAALDLGASIRPVVLVGASLALIPATLWGVVAWRMRHDPHFRG